MAETGKQLTKAGGGSLMLGSLQGAATMPVVRQIGLLVGLAASVAIGVAVVMWSQTPNYSPLYGNLGEKDGSQVVDALQRGGIPYKVDSNTGAVLVPSRDLHEVRLKLAAEGLPKGVGTGVGFESLDGQSNLGTSQFMETARYQRAIEVELARSIMTLSNVQSARVHLAIPKQSVFINSKQRPSASVLVNLYPGRTLEEGQVSAISHMVASSVPNLDVDRVSLVDQKGNLLTGAHKSREMELTSSQFAYTQQLEKLYTDRIATILAPIVGAEGVKAQVVADLDFSVTEQTQELFNPDAPAVRSEQTLEENSGSLAGGVPGALTNQPPGVATVPETPQKAQTGALVQQQGPQRTNRRSTVNYELDKTISHTRGNPGQIRRVSVAVVIDDKLVEGGKRRAHSPEELDRITELVKETVGFSAQRGDSVSVINTAFQSPEQAEPLPEPGLIEQPWFWDVSKQVLAGVVVLLMVFGVLRPVMRNLAKPGASRATGAAAGAAGEGGVGGEDQLLLSAAVQARQLEGPGAKGNYEARLEEIRAMVEKEPRLAAEIVRQWVAADS